MLAGRIIYCAVDAEPGRFDFLEGDHWGLIYGVAETGNVLERVRRIHYKTIGLTPAAVGVSPIVLYSVLIWTNLARARFRIEGLSNLRRELLRVEWFG